MSLLSVDAIVRHPREDTVTMPISVASGCCACVSSTSFCAMLFAGCLAVCAIVTTDAKQTPNATIPAVLTTRSKYIHRFIVVSSFVCISVCWLVSHGTPDNRAQA
jgi:hypothetical protein